MSNPSPPFPDAALRALLARFAAAAARVEAEGETEAPHFVYVDAFAGAEFAFGTGVARATEDETRSGAVVRAVETVDAAANCVLVEEDPAHLQRVYACLEKSGAEERVRGTKELATLAPGEIALVESPFRAVADGVAAYAGGAARSLAWLAPPAARELPWTALRAMLSIARGDLLVRLPVTDWEKQARFNVPLSDMPPFARRIVDGCSAMLDDAKHEWLPAWRAAERESGLSGGVETIATRFSRLLEHAAVGRTVRHLQLSPSGDAGPVAHLFLVTSDPLAALELNAAVRA
ncbi:MAG TPA: hypothetical protein VFQ39_01800, partial [Longimicrobium sp.]|nr:hypothetical protein [Longimicrobium sp.]